MYEGLYSTKCFIMHLSVTHAHRYTEGMGIAVGGLLDHVNTAVSISIDDHRPLLTFCQIRIMFSCWPNTFYFKK